MDSAAEKFYGEQLVKQGIEKLEHFTKEIEEKFGKRIPKDMKSLIENIESDVKNDTLNHRQNLKELEEKITSNFDSLNKLNAPI